MKIHCRSTVAEFLSDFVVYRNLIPCDPRLPPLAELAPQVGLASGAIPRKTDPEYGQAVALLLRLGRAVEAPKAKIQRLVFLGDTRLLDGTAFDNLCQAGGWHGMAFIGAESSAQPQAEVTPSPGGQRLYLANRWAALADFEAFCAQQGFPVDESTALVLDLDKTTVGARGRNAGPIDQARMAAVEETVASLLGSAYDQAAFRQAYDLLNQPEFHPFTADNQDYLAYICLVLGSGLYGLDEVAGQVRARQLISFEQFIGQVNRRRRDLSAGLRSIHGEIYAAVRSGDPTPFKAFRRNEYRQTVGRFGCLGDDAPMERLLKEEITITAEVRALALDWRARGALLFGLSDKPDEASLPTPELAAQGYQALHRTATHVVGE